MRVVCQVLNRPERITFIWSQDQAFFEPYHLTGPSLEEFRRAAREAQAALDSAAPPAALAQAGHHLYRAMFPDAAHEIRDWFAGLHRPDLEIVSDTPGTAPWNLVYDRAPDNPSASEFWGMRYPLAVGRRVNPWREASLLEEPEVVLIVDPGLRQELSESEKNRLNDFATDKGLLVVESREQLAATTKAEPPDVLYFFCRADADGLRVGDARLTTDDLSTLLEEERLDPIMFLNVVADSAAAIRPFLSAGLHGLIAGAIALSADTANAFGLECLQSFLYAGERLGIALQKAREKIGVAGLAYNAYCPGGIRVAADNMTDEEDGPEPAPLPEEPYRPLMPYDREDRALFAGRDDDITAFADLLDQSATRLLLLHGASGVGKSSFLRAGVVPRLEHAIGYRALRDRTPEDEPVAEADHLVLAIPAGHDFAGQIAEALCAFCAQPYLYTTPTGGAVTVNLPGILRSFTDSPSTAIQSQAPGPSSGDGPAAAAEAAALSSPATDSPEDQPDLDPAELWRRLNDDPSLLGRLVAQLTDRLPHELLIVIEQGEEPYSQANNPVPARKRRQALDMLARAAAMPSLCKWIISLRTDYFGRLLHELPASAEAITRDFLLGPLSDDEMLEAVLLPTAPEPVPYSAEAPQSKYQFSYEDGLAKRVVTEVRQAARTSQQSALPLLQAVCAGLVNNLQGRPDRVIHASDLEDLGAESALAKYVDERIKALPVTSQEQRALRDLWQTLYTRHPDGALTRHLLAAQVVANAWRGAQPGETVQHACEARLLEANRLLVAGKENDYISLGQDSLARVGERWAEETRKRQFGRSKIVDLMWIFIPLLVLVAAVTLYFARRTGGGGGASPEKTAEMEKLVKQALRANQELKYALLIHKADQAWQRGSIFQAGDYLTSALQSWTEDQPTPFEWNYLNRLVNAHRLELGTEPQSGVLAMSADGKLVASAGDKGVILVFDTSKGQVQSRLHGHTGKVESLAFAGQGKTLVSAGQDRTVRLWDPVAGKEPKTLTGHDGPVLAVAVSKDGATVVSGGEDKTAVIWSVKDSRPRFKLTAHTAAVHAVALDPGDKICATAGADQAIYLWNLESGQRVQELKGHTGPIRCLAFAPDGQTLASGGVDYQGGADLGRVRQWDVKSGKETGAPLYHGAGVFSAVYSHDGTVLFTAGKDEVIRAWDAKTGAARAAQPAHTDWIFSLAVAANGQTLASGGKNDKPRLWDLADLLAANELRGHTDWVTGVAFSPDGKLVVSGGRDKTLRFWDAATGKPLHTLEKLDGAVLALSLTSDKEPYRLAAALSSDAKKGLIVAWEVKPGDKFNVKQLYRLEDHTGEVTAIGFAPDGKLLASTSRDQAVRLWDADAGKPKHTLQGHKDAPVCLAWSLDGKLLASAGESGLIYRWDPQTGKQAGLFGGPGGHTGPITCLVFLPPVAVPLETGEKATVTRLVSGSQDQSLRMWFVELGLAARNVFREHGGAVTSVAWNSNAKVFVSGGWDNVVKVWGPESGADRLTLTGHTGAVRGVAFSPDGRILASASHDGSVRLWRTTPPVFRPRKQAPVDED